MYEACAKYTYINSMFSLFYFTSRSRGYLYNDITPLLLPFRYTAAGLRKKPGTWSHCHQRRSWLNTSNVNWQFYCHFKLALHILGSTYVHQGHFYKHLQAVYLHVRWHKPAVTTNTWMFYGVLHVYSFITLLLFWNSHIIF